ncbi:MAG: hypothetical protein H7A24_02975 [Leptospiraceae bacterium]|nr:hypothetical protein [Leptospiraceae bacterium]MCP5510811.1 hypothetical protein [Leptospiraceae bacterium]
MTLFVNLFLFLPLRAEEESKPLLRVFPIYRPEECDWAIRWDICLACMRMGERYAQKIYFPTEGGPIRVHGCFTNQKGFTEWQKEYEERYR